MDCRWVSSCSGCSRNAPCRHRSGSSFLRTRCDHLQVNSPLGTYGRCRQTSLNTIYGNSPEVSMAIFALCAPRGENLGSWKLSVGHRCHRLAIGGWKGQRVGCISSKGHCDQDACDHTVDRHSSTKRSPISRFRDTATATATATLLTSLSGSYEHIVQHHR